LRTILRVGKGTTLDCWLATQATHILAATQLPDLGAVEGAVTEP
jgi:hypothetical protein